MKKATSRARTGVHVGRASETAGARRDNDSVLSGHACLHCVVAGDAATKRTVSSIAEWTVSRRSTTSSHHRRLTAHR